MRVFKTLPFVLAFLTAGGGAHAADPKLVTFYKDTCGTCHGESGEGTKGLAPPLKGNKFVTEGSASDIGATITKGREGAAKKYKDLASPMPANSMSDSRLQALMAYLKGDLQK
jgi:mono/diheme cytochrome c family protein